MWNIRTTSPNETFELGQRLGQLLQEEDVICLTGDLGAGKTLITQGIAAALGVEQPVTSPTFTVLNIYEGKINIYHFDLYRLEQPEELEDIGFSEFTSSGGVVIIEWSDKFPGNMPEKYLQIMLKRGTENEERLISFLPNGKRYVQICEELNK
jgi:tRNA threonylcarbamoyladenosine biosynthesis protein TsaE